MTLSFLGSRLTASRVSKLVGILLILFSQNVLANDSTLIDLIRQRRFPLLHKMMNEDRITNARKGIVSAVLANAWNRPSESERLLTLCQEKNESGAWGKVWWETHIDNLIKQDEYADIYSAQQHLLTNFERHLSAKKKNDLRNTLNLWSALRQTPKQSAIFFSGDTVSLTRDIAGLWNVTVESVTSNNFIFDTGAGYSVMSASIAAEMGVQIIENHHIDVLAGITGNKIKSKIGILPEMKLGDRITIRNVVFLVFPDESLSFADGRYVIKGIIGLPVIAALKNITIENDRITIQPMTDQDKSKERNLYLDNTKPVVYLQVGNEQEPLPFTLDTGADASLLNGTFFRRFGSDYSWKDSASIDIGGAGGSREMGIVVFDTIGFTAFDSGATLHNVGCSKESLPVNQDTYYGNIGKDFFGKFQKIHLDFHNSMIQFVDKR